jgi:hypothetical protein
MHHARPINTSMLRLLDPTNDMFKKTMEYELVLELDKSYLLAIGALMYLANQTRPEILFAISLLALHISQLTIRCQNVIKRIFMYLQETIDMKLYF